MVNDVRLELQLENTNTLEGYLINNQGKRIKCRVTTNYRGDIVFSQWGEAEEVVAFNATANHQGDVVLSPIETVEEGCDRNANND